MTAEKLAAAGLRVKPLEIYQAWFVTHAAGGFTFFCDEDEAQSYAYTIDRPCRLYCESAVNNFGDRLRAAYNAWEQEEKQSHVARILAALEEAH